MPTNTRPCCHSDSYHTPDTLPEHVRDEYDRILVPFGDAVCGTFNHRNLATVQDVTAIVTELVPTSTSWQDRRLLISAFLGTGAELSFTWLSHGRCTCPPPAARRQQQLTLGFEVAA